MPSSSLHSYLFYWAPSVFSSSPLCQLADKLPGLVLLYSLDAESKLVINKLARGDEERDQSATLRKSLWPGAVVRVSTLKAGSPLNQTIISRSLSSDDVLESVNPADSFTLIYLELEEDCTIEVCPEVGDARANVFRASVEARLWEFETQFL